METKEIVGIDFSKETFDVFIETSRKHMVFRNGDYGFKQFVKWLHLSLGEDLRCVHIVMEHTGIYSFLFEKFLHQDNICFSKVSGLKIKKSAGLVRGKSDKIDAKMIARYGCEKRKELKLQKPSSEAVLQLKNLLSLRDKMVRDRAGYIARWNEQKQFLDLSMKDILIQAQQAVIRIFDKQIEKVEEEIETIIKSDEALHQNFKLLKSITGVGMVTATYLIAFTENFTAFETSRQFACYSGIAPFPYESGISVKAKTKVSVYGYKKLKTLLHLCALSAMKHNPEIKEYYERRTVQGKNKMSTLNIIRNKILSRMFAVVARKSEYKIEWLHVA
jgi:transposase